jgi:hypothetical protein
MHLFNKYLLRAYYFPSTVTGFGKTAVNRTEENSSITELYSGGMTDKSCFPQ